jgi:hypothetical protein
VWRAGQYACGAAAEPSRCQEILATLASVMRRLCAMATALYNPMRPCQVPSSIHISWVDSSYSRHW